MGRPNTLIMPNTTPVGNVRSWVADLRMSNALDGKPLSPNAPAITDLPEKNSMKKKGSLLAAFRGSGKWVIDLRRNVSKVMIPEKACYHEPPKTFWGTLIRHTSMTTHGTANSTSMFLHMPVPCPMLWWWSTGSTVGPMMLEAPSSQNRKSPGAASNRNGSKPIARQPDGAGPWLKRTTRSNVHLGLAQ